MKKMTKVISLALALVMCLALCACGSKTDDGNTAADGKRTFIMGVDPEYPPFSYLGDDGKYTGFDVEIAQAACDLLGWDLQVFGAARCQRVRLCLVRHDHPRQHEGCRLCALQALLR